jgi:preprotein translocase SecE subunit
MNALITYLHHVRDELGHVSWPTWQEALGHTLMIILVSVITAALVGVIDYALTSAVSAIVGG